MMQPWGIEWDVFFMMLGWLYLYGWQYNEVHNVFC